MLLHGIEQAAQNNHLVAEGFLEVVVLDGEVVECEGADAAGDHAGIDPQCRGPVVEDVVLDGQVVDAGVAAGQAEVFSFGEGDGRRDAGSVANDDVAADGGAAGLEVPHVDGGATDCTIDIAAAVEDVVLDKAADAAGGLGRAIDEAEI